MGQLVTLKLRSRWNNVFVHLLLWGVIFILPYFFMDSERVFTWRPFLRSIPEMLGFILVFYLNYFFLIDKFLYRGKTKSFIIYNVLLILGVAFMMHYGRELLEQLTAPPETEVAWEAQSVFSFTFHCAQLHIALPGYGVKCGPEDDGTVV